MVKITYQVPKGSGFRKYVLLMIVAIAVMGMVGDVSGEVHYINNTVLNGETTRYIIDQPGTYVFDEDIIDLEFPCDTSGDFYNCLPLIWVRSSDVIIEGNGHILDAIDIFNGVYQNDISAILIGEPYDYSEIITYRNISVSNLTLSDWNTGIESSNIVDCIFEYNSIISCSSGVLCEDQLGELPSNFIIRKNSIMDGGSGISVYQDSIGTVIENNQISRISGEGISVITVTNPQVIGNIVTDCENTGIVCQDGEGGRISDNIVTGCGDGITPWNNDMEVVNNTGSYNQVGLYLRCSYSTIQDNIISGNSQYGILINEYEESYFFNNYLSNSENVFIEYGSDFFPVCYWNTLELIPESNIIGGPSIGGNYWGNPDGNGFSDIASDANGDGFADEYYVVNSGYFDFDYDGTPEYVESVDYFPLVEIGQSSDNQPPIVSFSFEYPESDDKDYPTPDDILSFSDNSQDYDEGDFISTWLWDFGDGTTSTDQNPTHQFAISGPYQVTLIVTDSFGAEGSYSEEIVIDYPPDVSFTMDPEPPIEAGQTMIFTGTVSDQDGTVQELAWIIDGADISGVVSTEESMTYTFETAGLYLVIFSATDEMGAIVGVLWPIVVNDPSMTTYFMLIPGLSVEDGQLTITQDTTNQYLAQDIITISGDDVIISMNGLTTTIHTDGLTENDGLITGTVVSGTIETTPIQSDISDLGLVEAAFSADLASDSGYGSDSGMGMTGIVVNIAETAAPDVMTAYELAATDASLEIVDVAYAFNIIGATLENGVDVLEATIVMTAPESWVTTQGGPDNIRIFRYSEYDGTTEILIPDWVFESETGTYTFTAFSPNGLSVFSLVAVTEEGPSDTTAPEIQDILATPNPAPLNTPISVTATIDDTMTGGSVITSVEYSIDGSTWLPMSAVDGTLDEISEQVQATIPGKTSADVFTLVLKASDAAGNVATSESILVAVYDPNGSFVTAGGWINSPAGAYKADSSVTGKANMGLNCKYKSGSTIPTGETEFQLKEANLKFKATSYDWLVILGDKAIYRGTGTINGEGQYGFLVSAIAGEISGGEDKFRMKIWNKTTSDIIYDNGYGTDTASPVTPLGGGNVKIH